MTTPKGVVVLSPESTSQSRFLASIESKNQILASFEKFFSDKRPERGRKTRKKDRKKVTQTMRLLLRKRLGRSLLMSPN